MQTMAKPQIKIKRILHHSKADIWKALTTKEAMDQWLMEAKGFRLEKGKEFQLITKPQGGFDGVVNCSVLDFEEYNSLSYTWASNTLPPTIVHWELKELEAGKTMLTLSHDGFNGLSGWFTKQILNFGWKSLISKKLKKYLQQ